MEVQAFSRGQLIIRPGERLEQLYLIVRAQVRIAYTDATGVERGATIAEASAAELAARRIQEIGRALKAEALSRYY
jgi:hypothetical protein